MDRTSDSVIQIAGARRAIPPRAPSQTEVAASDFRIDGWLVQPSLNRLTRDEVVVRVRPQLMDLLVCLASCPGTVLGRDELMARVWDGRWVVESAISRCVAELRALLADSAQQPRIIETISKRGYRLIAPVERTSAPDPPPPAEADQPDAGSRSLRGWLTGFLRRWASGTDGRR